MELHLENINKVSPYKVEWEEETKEVLLFLTSDKRKYRVAFVLDEYNTEDLVMYQLELKTDDEKRCYDGGIHRVVCAIIEEFLRANQKAILYAADSSDGREKCRQRLFFRWFNKIEKERGNIHILKPIGDIAGLIIRKDNPQLEEYLEVVDDFCETLEK